MPPRAQDRGAPRGGPPRGGRGGGRGRGAQPTQPAQAAHQPPAAHITTVGVRRPGYGASGRPININVNSFTATIPDGAIYHYDVISAEKNLPSAMNMRLIKALQDHIAPSVFAHTRVVFDGRKNLFAPLELKLGDTGSREFDVTLPGQQTAPTSDRPPRIYKIRLTLVAKINTEVLHRFIQGKQSQDNAVSTALMALNVVIRMEPSQRFPVKGRSFFTPDETKALGGGLVLWRGYFQSIRPAVNRMLINVDISTGVMYEPGPLIRLCLAFLDRPGNNPMVLKQMPDRERLALGRFIAGIRVQTKDAGSGMERARVVRKLTKEGASQLTFIMRGGGSKTVAAYFREITNKSLQFPDLPCVEVGQGALIPLELCTVLPGQLVKREVPDDKKALLVEFATMAPMNRLASIRKGLDVLAYGQSEYVRQFGLTVDNKLLSTTARVLQAPMLQYGVGSKSRTVNPARGAWNMADKKFFRPSAIRAWVLIIFETQARFNDRTVQEMSAGFVEGCTTTGMTVEHKIPLVRRVNGQGDIPAALQLAGKACVEERGAPPTLFVFVLPEGGNDLYTIVKHWGDVKKGIATQCLKSRKCSHAKIQFWANVALKVNVKLGGINVITEPTQVTVLSDPHNPTVVMGADVMHPGAGTNGRPSFSAVVSSVDSHGAKYVATSRVQASRQELISDLQPMTVYLLSKYMSYRQFVEKVPSNLKAPKRLIFYRAIECRRLPAACAELNIAPRITLVIVGKRHHVRLFPTNDKDADRSGNCPAGTVVDKDIGHPTEFDFYLQSHGGLLGTSRPAHYSDNNLTADTMQALSFALCHVYAGSTRSVSIPAPVYYADTVCARAKIHFDPLGASFSDSGATEASTNLEAFKNDYLPLHNEQTNRMYFSVSFVFVFRSARRD
ncbi:argonaute-like protein [Mycena rosella]|uniref:Argonaute-like protein n=1 Tax=Mycena rosella TaxID=1033263 RepID=A0AAD7CA50_MYCRO|nr:argonaute-like protein [Mycena rosella]